MTVYCQAIVDPCGPAWRVTVTERPPGIARRVYFLSAKSEGDAAWEGIKLFEEEMKIRKLAPEGQENIDPFRSVRRMIAAQRVA